MGGNRYVYGMDGGDGLMVYTYPQTHRVVYMKHVQLFTYQSYLNKVVKEKKKSRQPFLVGVIGKHSERSTIRGSLPLGPLCNPSHSSRTQPSRRLTVLQTQPSSYFFMTMLTLTESPSVEVDLPFEALLKYYLRHEISS